MGQSIQKDYQYGEFIGTAKLEKQGKLCDEKTVIEQYNSKEVITEILNDLDTIGRLNGLKGFELIKRIKLIDELFSIENNLITPTLKLKRTELKKKFYNDILNLYLNS